MLRFAALFDEIDSTTSTNAKVAAMARYFAEAPPADAAWAVFFLTGRRLKRLVPYAAIHDWTLADTRLPSWLLEESYSVVGDGAETAALVLDQLPVDRADRHRCRWRSGSKSGSCRCAAWTRRRSAARSRSGGRRSIGCSASSC